MPDRALGPWPWVAVAERLPDRDAKYLVHCPSADPGKPLTTTAWFDPGEGWSLLPKVRIDGITHWMPMPGPPAKKREGVDR